MSNQNDAVLEEQVEAELKQEVENEERREAFTMAAKEISVPWKGLVNGQEVDEVKIKYYPLTRYMRNKAMQEAMDVYLREHPGTKEGEGIGGDIVVAERELAVRMIKWWSLPKPANIIWDFLDEELGDAIVEALGINKVYSVGAGMDGNEEVVEAKN